MISWRVRGAKAVRSADDHELQILPFAPGSALFSRTSRRGSPPRKVRLIEYPLRRAVEQRQERLVHHGSIEPEMHAGDRRRPQIAQIRKHGFVFDNFRRKQFEQDILRHGCEDNSPPSPPNRLPFPRPRRSHPRRNPAGARAQLDVPALLASALRQPSYNSPSGTRECRRDTRRDVKETLSRKRRCRTARRCDPILRRAR